jgi:two-component system response regulator YesN
LTILIADDEELARYSLKTLISRHYEQLDVIAEAADGEEAVRLADQYEPDLAILDIRMPVMDGLEASRRIRSAHPDMDIIILTAYEDFSFAQQAVNIGINGYLLKPVSQSDFSAQMDSVNHRQNRLMKKDDGPEISEPLSAGEFQHAAVSWRLGRALEFIRNHMTNDLPLNTVAEAAGISAQHLSRLFRDELDTKFVKFVTERRMDMACRLLDTTTLGVAEVALQCGYRDANYFAKVFRKSRGLSPGDYRNGLGLKRPLSS